MSWTQEQINNFSTLEKLVWELQLKGDYTRAREIVVSKTGGDFDTINAAILKAKEIGGKFVIKIYPGTYVESVKAIAMTGNITLLGLRKELCIVQMDYSDYYHPPLDVSGEILVEELTFKSTNTLGKGQLDMYAVHADFEGPGVTEFLNCNFISNIDQHTIGSGARANQTLRFRKCNIIHNSPKVNAGIAALYWHTAVANLVPNQHLEVFDSEIYSAGDTALYIHDANQTHGGTFEGNSLVSTFRMNNNTLFAETNNSIIKRLENYRKDGAFAGNIYLDARSTGNNVPILNHQ